MMEMTRGASTWNDGFKINHTKEGDDDACAHWNTIIIAWFTFCCFLLMINALGKQKVQRETSMLVMISYHSQWSLLTTLIAPSVCLVKMRSNKKHDTVKTTSEVEMMSDYEGLIPNGSG
eukprot:759383_1